MDRQDFGRYKHGEGSFANMAPWHDRSGQFSPFKTAIFGLLFVPALVIGVDYATDNLGPRALNEVIHLIGLWAIRLLMLSLAVTPLRQIWQWPRLIVVRRMLGVAAFVYAVVHLVAYTASLAFKLEMLVVEIVVRIYLTIGFVALLALAALAITSTDGMARRLGGKRWRRLHRLVYPIAIAAVVHHFMQVKADLTEPLLMTGALVWLLAYRLLTRNRSPARPPTGAMLIALTIAVAVVLALGEAGYYLYRFNAPPLRVLSMNLDFSFGPRPVWWVLGTGVAVSVVGMLRVRRAKPSAAVTRAASSVMSRSAGQ